MDVLVRNVIELQYQAALRGEVSLWTVYDHPKDFPGKIAARMFLVARGQQGPTQYVIVAPDLAKMRSVLAEAGLTRLPREDGDDPKIVESWV